MSTRLVMTVVFMKMVFMTMVFVTVTLGGCQSHPPSHRAPEMQDGPPGVIPAGLADLPDPEVRHERRSARGNPQSYTVRGKTYRVIGTAQGYRKSGNASWYGRKFHGRTTSSGEPFDMYQLTAAHRSLPIPTYVKVTNLENGRTTVVRINDRGPFHEDRIIDLSYAAAVKLGFAARGTARVRVEAVPEGKGFVLQAGAFSDLERADKLKEALESLTGRPTFVVRVSGEPLYRVRLGPVKGRTEAERLQGVISAADYGTAIILPH
ncbi:MAG: septal ring lytic transglycosylase RlpA family protein [Pseudomonadales bacterium]